MDTINKLYEAYQNFMSLRNTESIQRLFNAYTEHTGYSLGSWSCGGCCRRTKEKTEMILHLAGLIDKPKKFINK